MPVNSIFTSSIWHSARYGTGSGIVGPTGPQGLPGQDGATWFVGSGAPSVSLGLDDDLYLNAANGNVFKKDSGIWTYQLNITGPEGPVGPEGPLGVSGLPGSHIYVDSGVPSNLLGMDSDLYFESVSGQLYLKENGIWVYEATISGPQGVQGDSGSLIYTDSGTPQAFLGKDTDVYIDTVSGDLYQKSGGIWIYRSNLIGPQGQPGSTGSGDFDLNSLQNLSGKIPALSSGTVTFDSYETFVSCKYELALFNTSQDVFSHVTISASRTGGSGIADTVHGKLGATFNYIIDSIVDSGLAILKVQNNESYDLEYRGTKFLHTV